MLIRQIFDPYLAQYAYLIGCQRSGEALVIDPERDIDRLMAVAKENNLRITAVAETHIHADFVSGAREFAQDPAIALMLSGEGGDDWTVRWAADRPNTRFLKHGERFSVGNINVQAIHTPGHTPEHMSYLITDWGGGADEPIALATGDFLFVGDVGRPDLLESAAGQSGVMEPSARALREALKNSLSAYGDYLQILPGHGAGSACGKALGAVPTTTLGYERRFNGALKLAISDADAFVSEILSGQPEPPPYFARMKHVNRDGITVTGRVPIAEKLDESTFRARLADATMQILDTRDDRVAFDAAHAKNAIHAPLHGPFFSTSAGSYLDADRPIVLIVESSKDVDLAVRQLYRIGFDHVAGWITAADAMALGLLDDRMERMEFCDFDADLAQTVGTIIDVRTRAEFARGALPGARSFPYTRLAKQVPDLMTDRKLFIHCGSGKRASLAGSYLKSRGFDVVHVDGVCEECERIAQSEGVMH